MRNAAACGSHSCISDSGSSTIKVTIGESMAEIVIATSVLYLSLEGSKADELVLPPTRAKITSTSCCVVFCFSLLLWGLFFALLPLFYFLTSEHPK